MTEAATIYGIGKAFFWPTSIGVVSEQSPRGGAITINVIAGVGMLAAGIVGSPLIGGVQDNVVLIILPRTSATSVDATAKPRRHPLMLYDLLNV